MHTANALGVMVNILSAFGGQKLDYPMYTDLIGGKETQDTRSAEEIRKDILKRLQE